jgi:hypothetical protein
MSEERRKILEMLAQGKIEVADAERLLNAVGEPSPAGREEAAPESVCGEGKAKYLRVVVHEKEGDRVDIRVPFQLMRAGMKLASLIPQDAQVKIDNALGEKGVKFNLSDINVDTIEQLVDSMKEFNVDVAEKDGTKVRVFCE